MSQFNDALVFFGEKLVSMFRNGDKAIITQPYTEVNSKTGDQYELAFLTEALGIGATTEIIIVTGSSPLAIKGLGVRFNGDSISAQIFKGPSYTGGTAINTYTLRDATGKTSGATFLGGATVSSTGTAVGPLINSLGSATVGGRALTTLSIESGVERILEANSTYCYQLTNTSGAAQDISGVVTWFEGVLDF